MEYKCWGIMQTDVCIYLEAENPQDAANKAFAAFERKDEGVSYHDDHIDDDIAVQEKVDGEYGDELILSMSWNPSSNLKSGDTSISTVGTGEGQMP